MYTVGILNCSEKNYLSVNQLENETTPNKQPTCTVYILYTIQCVVYHRVQLLHAWRIHYTVCFSNTILVFFLVTCTQVHVHVKEMCYLSLYSVHVLCILCVIGNCCFIG